MGVDRYVLFEMVSRNVGVAAEWVLSNTLDSKPSYGLLVSLTFFLLCGVERRRVGCLGDTRFRNGGHEAWDRGGLVWNHPIGLVGRVPEMLQTYTAGPDTEDRSQFPLP